MTRKQRRLAMIGSGLAVLGIAVVLVLSAIKDSIVFFNSPSDVVEKHIQPGARIRLGGLVKPGSVERGENLSIRFEVTDGNRSRVAALVTHHSQERFVAPMVRSLDEAAHPPLHDGAPVVPWMRAIEADGEIAGFLMTAEPRWPGEPPYLWRLLIDRRHQGRRIGTRAIDRLVERLRAEGHERLLVNWVRDQGGPEPFYLGLGFRLTGRIEDGEHEGELLLG